MASKDSDIALARFKVVIEQCRLKVNRAYRHIDEIERSLEAFIQSDFCGFGENIYANPGTKIVPIKAKPVPSNISLSIGDCFYSLSCALDYISSGVVSIMKGDTKRITFPVKETRQALKDSFRRPKRPERGSKGPEKGLHPNRKIVEACPGFALLILCKIKPYPGGGNLAWEVRKACNIDKHNLIIPIATPMTLGNFSFVDEQRNIKISRSTIRTHPMGGGRAPVMIMGNATKIQNQGKPSVKVAFPNSAEVFAGDPVIPTLIRCAQGITEVIDICDTHLPPAFLSI